MGGTSVTCVGWDSVHHQSRRAQPTSAYPHEHKRTTGGPSLQPQHNGVIGVPPQQDEALPLAGAAALLERPTVVQASIFSLLAVTQLRMLWTASSSTRASLL